MLKKILFGGVVALGATLAYTIREYSKNIDDYNALAEKCNRMSDFIDNCDFYNYKDPKKNDENSRFISETEDSDGFKRTVKQDVATGFSVISYERA